MLRGIRHVVHEGEPTRNNHRSPQGALRGTAQIIEFEYPQTLELECLAHRLASSPRQLQRAFAEAGGLSFREHIHGVRMARAADLLRETPLPVSEIAGAVGYRQAAQFAKAFRRRHGQPPSDYRFLHS